MNTRDLGKYIDSKTWMPMGSGLAILAVTVTVTWKASNYMRDIRDAVLREIDATRALHVEDFNEVDRRIELLEREDRVSWQLSDQVEWTSDFWRQNPELTVPDPREIQRSRRR